MNGCGYTTGSAIPARFKTIYIEQFKNKIDFTSDSQRNLYMPLLEVKVRNAIINRFLFDGNLRITDKKDEADFILSGELLRYERFALRFTDNNDAEESRVQIIVAMKMWDNQKQEVYWEEGAFAGEATYFVRGALATTEASAVEEATVDLGRRVTARTVEDW